MFRPAFVCMSVCLSVSLLATSHKNYWSDITKILPDKDKDIHSIAITPFKVIQGHRFWYQSKAHIWLPISD